MGDEGVGKKLFENDMETVNNYEKEKIYENIKYIPHIYTADLNKKALPYRRTYLPLLDPID